MLLGILRTVYDRTLGWYNTLAIKYRDPDLYNFLVAFSDDDPHETE